ncbi:MAG: hypothetical protein AAFO04_17230 [Cyanobacteria bacterium J06592_8]
MLDKIFNLDKAFNIITNIAKTQVLPVAQRNEFVVKDWLAFGDVASVNGNLNEIRSRKN